jgi:hypothetical protein
MINITYTPFDSLSQDITPVYNGLQYVVDGTGNWPLRLGWKYIADVYVDGVLRTRLKHNPNVSTDSGYFDVGSIVETEIYNEAPINNSSTDDYATKSNTVRSFEVKFGAEMDRRDNIKSWFVGGGLANITPEAQRHNLRTGDAVIVEGSETEDYNGVFSVSNATTSSFRINQAYIDNPDIDGSFIECEAFDDNSYYYDPTSQREFIGFLIPLSRPTEIEVGDTVMVRQFDGFTIGAYNGEWLVTDIDTKQVGFLTYNRIVTNCPYLGNTTYNGGAIYPVNRKRVNPNEATTDGKTFNGVLQYDEFNDWNPTEYILDSGTPGKFLTNLPTLNMINGLNFATDDTRMVRVGTDEYMTLTSFYSTSIGNSLVDELYVKWYDEDNNLISDSTISYGTLSASQAAWDYGVGPKNKEIADNKPANTKYYTVELRLSSTAVSEKITIYIRDCDTRYTNTRVKYLNRLGGWDYFDFNKRSDERVEVSRSNFRQNLVSFTSGGFGYDVGRRGQTTYNINGVRKEKIRTDWLKDGEVEALEELWTSPQVFFLKGDEMIPINIITNALQVGKAEDFGLKRYEIEYQHANNIFTQRL